MKFTLVWQGKLPSSGNKSKPADVARIRADLSPQLEYLWQTHPALQVLKDCGFINNPASRTVNLVPGATSRYIAEHFPGSMIDLCEPLSVGGHKFKPLVRKSLDLSCRLDVLFLRQDDPGAIISQGGDLDGRIKVLLDALRMPTNAELTVQGAPAGDTYCLMEADTLVSGLEVETERLLLPPSTHPHEAQLVVDVTVRVLRVHEANYCLL